MQSLPARQAPDGGGDAALDSSTTAVSQLQGSGLASGSQSSHLNISFRSQDRYAGLVPSPSLPPTVDDLALRTALNSQLIESLGLSNPETLTYLIDHVFLPPRISRSPDSDPAAVQDAVDINRNQDIDDLIADFITDPEPPEACEKTPAKLKEVDLELCLLSFVGKIVSQFSASHMLPSPRESTGSQKIQHVVKMLQQMATLQAVNSESLQEKLLCALRDMRQGDIITLHLEIQNAAIIFHHLGSTISFSSFEVSPQNSNVLASPCRLRCSYPGTRVSIPAEVFSSPDFLTQLTNLLVSMRDALPTDRPRPLCADSETVDYMDTVAPIYITEFLTGLLRGIGEGVSIKAADGNVIFKRVGDEVLAPLNDGRPWRRSPIWLVIRVALQTSLLRYNPGITEPERHCDYKLLMLYILAKLLEVVIQLGDVENEKLSHMYRKLSRRAAKLEATGVTIPTTLMGYLSQTIQGAATLLENRFAQVKLATVRDLKWPPAERLDVIRDTEMKMVNSRAYIRQVLEEYRGKAAVAEYTVFSRNHAPRLCHHTSGPDIFNLEALKANGVDRQLLLHDIEFWVETALEGFVNTNSKHEQSCHELHELLTFYCEAADHEYAGNPVNRSLMLLIAIELWIAIDRIAVSTIPLLKEYPCELDPDWLLVLLLPTATHLKRLQNVTDYLHTRQLHATKPSMFERYTKGLAATNIQSFSVRFFDKSTFHQQLYDTIIKEAAIERDQKLAEFTHLKRKYDALVEHAVGMCTCGATQKQQCRTCGREFRFTASSLMLTRHQWPLPSDTLQAKTIVFELDLPIAFAAWRDATYRAVMHFSPLPDAPPESSNAPGRVSTVAHVLTKYFRQKSQLVTFIFNMREPKEIKIESVESEESFLVWPTMQCEYLGATEGGKTMPIAEAMSKVEALSHLNGTRCTFQLPTNTAALQYAVNSTNHSPNYVICNQSACPAGWSIQEYYAFTMLRSGFRLQWLNILREIKAGNLYLNRIEVCHLFQQTIWQTGPQGTSNSYLRESHQILHDEDFCGHMLDALEDSLAFIKGNWLQHVSMQLVISLGARILSVALDGQSKSRAAYFLRTCRTVCMDWLVDIFRHIHSSSDDANREKWQTQALVVAATCRLTFDVDMDVFFAVFDSERDLADFIECATCMYHTAQRDTTNHEYSHLLDRNARLAHGMEPYLRELVATNNDWFDSAICRILPHYIAGGQWKVLEAPNDRWITTKAGGDAPMILHYNLLEGALLVDGIPLANLPKEYVEHPLYARLFQKRTFLVAKTGMPGMELQTVHSVFAADPELKIFFGMRNGELIIRTRRGSNVHEIIPHEKLAGDFPKIMLNSYLHFLELNQQKLEFRQLQVEESLWAPSNKDWVVTISEWKDSWSAHGQRTFAAGELHLIDYHSPTQTAIARIFESIEIRTYIQVTVSPKDHKVHARLSRYNLDFEFDGSHIEEDTEIACLTYPGMAIDAQPNVGQDMQTLYGLKSYLVLRDTELPLSNAVRTVLIPYGKVCYAAKKYYTSVWIDTHKVETVKYHLYTIDTLLGRLLNSDGSVKGLLYKIYLHALTSYCLPDPLIGVTGTEQALDELRSPRVWTFQKLDTDVTQHPSELELLHQLFRLTPTRNYVIEETPISKDAKPTNKALPMERIVWQADLSSYSQNGEFYFIVKSILENWQRFAMLQQTQIHDQLTVPNDTSDELLQKRASIREAAHLPTDYGGNLHSRQLDHVYKARNFGAPVFEARVCRISRLTNQWAKNLEPTPILKEIMREWKVLDTGAMKFEYHHDLCRNSLSQYWYPLYDSCLGCSQEEDKYKLLFVLSAMAYCGETHLSMALIETILAFATNSVFRDLPSPKGSSKASIRHDDEACIKHTQAVQAELDKIWYRTKNSPKTQPIKHYSSSESDSGRPSPINVETLGSRNLRGLLDAKTPPHVQQPSRFIIDYKIEPSQGGSGGKIPVLDAVKELLDRFSMKSNISGFHQQYAKDLKQSWEALHVQLALSIVSEAQPINLPVVDSVESYMRHSMQNVRDIFTKISTALSSEPGETTVEKLLYITGLQPRITMMKMLSQLRALDTYDRERAHGWRRVLITLGKSISCYQRATRIYLTTRRHDLHSFIKEWENSGYVGWDPLQYPEWLLFEIENNLLIRPVQAKMAIEMLYPHTARSAVMQLNMGEGKSSVILPIVAATLADRKKFVRLVVLKSLSSQMFHLLVQRLGGLLNRRIYHVPFSRQLKTSLQTENVIQILETYRECMKSGGVLLTQPEHLLSFKLMGIELLCNGAKDLAGELLRTQHWLEKHARDIFDESDELLSIRYELIYTIGLEQPLELGAKRWSMIQEIFNLVKKHMPALKEQYPHGIDLIERHNAPGSFPAFARLLEVDAEEKLMKMIAKEIVTANLQEWLPQKYYTDRITDQVLQYVSEKDTNDEVLSELEEIPPFLLLLKGLIGHGIIAFALRDQRWRVNYGLRDGLYKSNLAVPYHAKDSPVPRAQFAHPDITIALTCLCYYYQGLTEQQLRHCFQRLHKLSDPEWEYGSWIKECRSYLPPPLRQLNRLNLDDAYQWSSTIYPLLKLTKRVIDFYLSVEVFPPECKEFPEKLSSSAWDLAEKKVHPTTGFSGTNDNRYLLPTSIEQLDLDDQAHTNAKVLSYLLRPENRLYKCAQTVEGQRLSGRELLTMIVDARHSSREIQVLLDVGAQVMDMDNQEVAQHWLTLASHRNQTWTAALFFNAEGELMAITKDGTVQPYMSSPYVRSTETCLLFLDEAYTRGTDIKLPVNSVAAVTLGPKLNKDKLVQACMRMRNLGQGQSVCFFAPPEVHRKIVDHCNKTHDLDGTDIEIETVDILSWVMHETCIQTQRSVAIWANQGILYQIRQDAWEKYINGANNIETFAAAWKEPDSKTLKQMYGTPDKQSDSVLHILDRKLRDPTLAARHDQLLAIKLKCQEHEITVVRESTLQQQQEREVVKEIEQERARVSEPPPAIEAHVHQLNQNLVNFINTGVPPPPPGMPGSPFCNLMDTLTQTSFSNLIEREPWSKRILATLDFSRTVELKPEHFHSKSDRYLRPVSWIISTGAMNNGGLTLLLISPMEANELLPAIQGSKFVHLHMYSAKIQELAPSFEDLTAATATIPPLVDKFQWEKMYPERDDLMIQMNLYAGELFFDNYETYRKTCEFLGIYSRDRKNMSKKLLASQSKNNMLGVGEVVGRAAFKKSTVKFLTRLVEARRMGMKIEQTHMGSLLQWRALQKEDWKEDWKEEGDEEYEDEDAVKHEHGNEDYYEDYDEDGIAVGKDDSGKGYQKHGKEGAGLRWQSPRKNKDIKEKPRRRWW